MADSMLPQRWIGPAAPESFRVSDVPSAPESTLKTVLEFLGLLRRHILLLLLFVAAVVGMMWYMMRHDVTLYRASAVIRLQDKSRDVPGSFRGGMGSPSLRPFTDPVLSQIQVLQSRLVAREVAQSAGLRVRVITRGVRPGILEDRQVATDAPNETLVATFSDSGVTVRSPHTTVRGAYGAPIKIDGVSFVIGHNPEVGSARLAVVPLEQATGEVQNSLRGRPRERTDVIDVSYVAADPILAQQVVDRAVEEFQALSASTAKQESMLRRQFVEQQLQKVEGMLADAQAVHNRFRSREKVYSSQEKFRAQQADLTNIEMRRQELNADREMYASLLNKLNENQGTGPVSARVSTLVASPGIASNQVVAQLFGRLLQLEASRDSLTSGSWGRAQANPDVQRLDTLIRSTQTRVVEAVRAQVAATDARLAALDNMRKTVAGELSTLPNTEAEEASLVAQVDAYNDEAKRLRQELQTAQIAEAAEAGQVEIVDLALPGEPIGSGRKPKFVIALLIGLGLGATVAYVLENYRPIIRRRDELEQMIAFPNLALIPRIDLSNGRASGLLGGRLHPRGLAASVFGNGNGHGHGHSNGHSNGNAVVENGVSSPPLLGTELVTVSETRSSSAEAYRTLRTNLLFSAAVRTLARVVVTSPGPTEGKSTTAANLAISFAQQGHRVLLMDCDLRRSRIHKMFGVPQAPGVTNVLLGNLSIVQAVRETAVDGLFILPSGPLPPNPAELLGSERMKATLDGLAAGYDIVIIDSPPLLAASDAAILTRHADGALVVVRAGKTERSALQTAIQQLATVGARVLGTVLNDPDAEVPKYARYYSYYYNNYYE